MKLQEVQKESVTVELRATGRPVEGVHLPVGFFADLAIRQAEAAGFFVFGIEAQTSFPRQGGIVVEVHLGVRPDQPQVHEILADSQPDDVRDYGHALEAAGNKLGRQILQALDLFLADPAMTSVLFDDGTRIVRYGSVESDFRPELFEDGGSPTPEDQAYLDHQARQATVPSQPDLSAPCRCGGSHTDEQHLRTQPSTHPAVQS